MRFLEDDGEVPLAWKLSSLDALLNAVKELETARAKQAESEGEVSKGGGEVRAGHATTPLLPGLWRLPLDETLGFAQILGHPGTCFRPSDVQGTGLVGGTDEDQDLRRGQEDGGAPHFPVGRRVRPEVVVAARHGTLDARAPGF